MKIIIDVSQSALLQVQEWIPCQAFRLRENQDGSFALMVTHDLQAARAADLDVHHLLEREKRQQPPVRKDSIE